MQFIFKNFKIVKEADCNRKVFVFDRNLYGARRGRLHVCEIEEGVGDEQG